MRREELAQVATGLRSIADHVAASFDGDTTPEAPELLALVLRGQAVALDHVVPRRLGIA